MNSAGAISGCCSAGTLESEGQSLVIDDSSYNKLESAYQYRWEGLGVSILMTSPFCSLRSVLFVRRNEVTLGMRIKPLVGVGGGDGTFGSFSTLDRVRDDGVWTFTEPIIGGR